MQWKQFVLPDQTIASKRDGREFSKELIADFLNSSVLDLISDFQMAALAKVVCLNGMMASKTVALTKGGGGFRRKAAMAG